MAVNADDAGGHGGGDCAAILTVGQLLTIAALPLSYFPWLIAILAGYMTLTQLVKGFYTVATAGNIFSSLPYS